MNRALLAFEGDALNPGMAAKNKDGTRYAAVEVALSCLDLELRYRTVEDVDRDRFSVWALKTILDAETIGFGGVLSDVISLELTRDRILHTLSESDADKVNTIIKEFRAGAEKDDFTKTPYIVKILKKKIF